MKRTIAFLLVSVVAVVPSLGGVEVVLKDGTRIEARDFRSEGGIYVLEMEAGYSVTIPEELVSSLAVEEDDPASATDEGDWANRVSPRTDPPLPPKPPPSELTEIPETARQPEYRTPRPRGPIPGAQSDTGGDGPEERSKSPLDPWVTTHPKATLPPGFKISEPEDLGHPTFTGARAGTTGTTATTGGFKRHAVGLKTRITKPSAGSAPVERESEAGIASWYGERFQGRMMAGGKPYDTDAMSAAHPTLPFGTLVLVTDAGTGRSIVLEVTDRGPSIEGRIVNLSYAAARQLGMVERGLADVRVDVLGT